MSRLTLIRMFLSAVFVFFAVAAYAEGLDISPDVSEEELERAVKARARYIDSLLTGKAAVEITESGNKEAMAILKRAEIKRKLIENQIVQRRFKDAMEALHMINISIMDALKLVRSKEKDEKKLISDLETAISVNDLYFGLAEKKKIKEGRGGTEAIDLLEEAKGIRQKADAHLEAEQYQDAMDAFNASTAKLKKAIAITKKKSIGVGYQE